MNEPRLAAALSGLVGAQLAAELTGHFLKLRLDCATGTLERASAGKFVETFVQCLQHIATGAHEAKPSVDDYLNRRAEQESKIPEGLRICASRIARSIYTLRNKRNVAHISDVEANKVDLNFCHCASAWIVAEMLASATGVSMQEAGDLIALVRTPVGTLVEEIDGTALVHGDLSIGAEILVLFHSRYPGPLTAADVTKSLSRRNAGSVRNKLRELHNEKLLHGNGRGGYRLTQAGYAAALHEITALAA